MAFRVELSAEALSNLDAISAYILHRGSFESAERWFNGIMAAIRSTAELPTRCTLADESKDLKTEIRLLLYGKRQRRYKVYFAIHNESNVIRVFHVRHWATRPADSDELQELMDDNAEPADAEDCQ